MEILIKITKMSNEVQNQQLRLFARINTNIKLQIFKEQKIIFHKIRNMYDENHEVLTLTSLILAIKKITSKLDNTKLNAINLNNKIIYCKQSKRDKLIGYWSIILQLKDKENFSFRQIATYLAKYHKFEVAHSTIYNLWIELEKNNKGKING